MFGRLAGEVVAVADAKGVRLEAFDGFDAKVFGPGRRWTRRRRRRLGRPGSYWNSHEGKRTGIWRDLAVHKRKTEIDRLVAEVAVVAKELHLDVPGIRALVTLIKQIEDGKRAQGLEALAELEQAMAA